MKTAKEWTNEQLNHCEFSNEEFEMIVKKIQIDAMKEGMWRAEELITGFESDGYGEYDRQRILEAADKLTIEKL